MRKPKVYHSLDEPPKDGPFVSVEEIEKNLEAEVAWADAHFGPHVPPLTRRGRPRRGTKTEPSKVHAVRLKESTWAALRARAKAAGLTTNAAVQLAIAAWASRSTGSGA